MLLNSFKLIVGEHERNKNDNLNERMTKFLKKKSSTAEHVKKKKNFTDSARILFGSRLNSSVRTLA